MRKKLLITLWCLSVLSNIQAQEKLQLNDQGYFSMPGLDVTVFSDIYPDGHQTGVTIIQHGIRLAANGDLRLEASPGQWSPVPKGGNQHVDQDQQIIVQELWYPDSTKNRKGFNPILYPDLTLKYSVSVTPLKGSSFKVTVDLEKAIPQEWVGKIGFNFELFPGEYFGKSFLMDGQSGQFPLQPNGPVNEMNDIFPLAPMASGNQLTIAPEDPYRKITFRSDASLALIDDASAASCAADIMSAGIFTLSASIFILVAC